jgi:hypothetical protein
VVGYRRLVVGRWDREAPVCAAVFLASIVVIRRAVPQDMIDVAGGVECCDIPAAVAAAMGSTGSIEREDTYLDPWI